MCREKARTWYFTAWLPSSGSRDSACKLLGRSLRNQPSKDLAFPHPQSRKDHYRKEDKPSCAGIVWKFLKWTINVTDDRNAKDDVNPAKNRTRGGGFHIVCPPILCVIDSGLALNCVSRYQSMCAKIGPHAQVARRPDARFVVCLERVSSIGLCQRTDLSRGKNPSESPISVVGNSLRHRRSFATGLRMTLLRE